MFYSNVIHQLQKFSTMNKKKSVTEVLGRT